MRGAASSLAAPAALAAAPTVASVSRWDLVTVMFAAVLMQYVWRIQEVLPVLAVVQFTSLISLGAIAAFALDSRRMRQTARLHHAIYRPIVVILLLAVVSVLTSVHQRVSFDFVTKNFVKTVVLVGVLAMSIRDTADVTRLLRVWLVSGMGYVLASALLADPESGRLGGARGNYDPNDLGLYAVSTMPLCVYFMRRHAARFDQLLGGAALLALLWGLTKTGSRGGFVALLAIACYGLIGLRAVRRSGRTILVLVAVAALLARAGDSYWERMQTLLAPDQDYNWSGQAQSGRIEIWKRGLGYMVQRPVLGVGANAFAIAEGTLTEEAATSRALGVGFKWSAAHNAYVQVGAELGIPGLAAFLTLLVVSLREARRISREAAGTDDRLLAHAFVAAVIGFAIGGAFISQAYATFLYFLLALLIGFSHVVNRTTTTVPSVISPQAATRRAGRRGGYGAAANVRSRERWEA